LGSAERSLYTLENKMSDIEKTIEKTEKVMAAFDAVKGELEVQKAYTDELEKKVREQRLQLVASLSALSLLTILFIIYLIIT
jgi:septal ring factor EnvC (AmiA/AmiB activator)